MSVSCGSGFSGKNLASCAHPRLSHWRRGRSSSDRTCEFIEADDRVWAPVVDLVDTNDRQRLNALIYRDRYGDVQENKHIQNFVRLGFRNGSLILLIPQAGKQG